MCYWADVLKQTNLPTHLFNFSVGRTLSTCVGTGSGPHFLHLDSFLVLFFATQCSSLLKINEIQFHLLANLQLLHVLHVSGAIDRQFKRTLTLILLQTAKPAALIQHKGRGYLHPQTVSEMIRGGYMNSLT